MTDSENVFFIKRPWPPLWEVTVNRGGGEETYISASSESGA